MVAKDFTYKVYTLPPTQNGSNSDLFNMEVIEVDDFLRAAKKGIFATLLSGFWLVKDRICRVQLKKDIEKHGRTGPRSTSEGAKAGRRRELHSA